MFKTSGAPLVFCVFFGPFEPKISTAKAASQESQLWDSHQLPWSKMVLSREIVQCKKRSCKAVGLGEAPVADFSPLGRENQSSEAFSVSSPFQR